VTGPLEPDGSTTDPPEGTGSRHPVLVSGRVRRTPVDQVRHRWVAVLSAAVIVVVVAVIAAVFPPPSAAPVPGRFDGVAVPPSGAFSTSAFCAAGSGTAAASTIFLTNSTHRTVTGVMTSVAPATSSGAVPTVRRTVAIPGMGSAAVDPATGLPAGDNASSFVFAGGGVVASEVVSGPNGWSTAPCGSETSSQWSFAGGSTTSGNTLTLSLFNPSATEAVVNVSFLTANGGVAPQAYQGLMVPPGQLVEENVGDYVQNESAIGTSVASQSGTVVATEFEQWSSGATAGLSLQLGAPALSSTWRFAQTTSLQGSTVDFTLANPGATPADATVSVGLASGTVVPRQVVVPASSSAVFVASGSSGLPKQVPFSVTVTSDAPIVVGRSVQAPAGASTPAWGSASGTSAPAGRWLVPAPGITGAPGTANATVTSLAVANPGPSTARVTVSVLGSARTVATLAVGAGRLVVLGPSLVGGLSTLVVSADLPVNVEEDSGPTGAPGVVSSSGFPFVG
jgi:hypothetical protein